MTQKTKEKLIQEFREKFELHDVGKYQFTICTNNGDDTCNGGVSVDEIELESAERLLDNIESFLSHALNEVEEETISRVRKSLERLLDEKRAKALVKNLELYMGTTSCKICGTDPLRQRKMILDLLSTPDALQEKKEEHE